MNELLNNLNPYTYSSSAFIIGLVLANELNSLEQSSVGNWLQLVGLTVQTYSSQQAVISDNQTTNSNNNNEDELDTIKKAIDKISNELEKMKNNCQG